MSVPAVLGSILPTIGVGTIFYLVMRGVIRADRNERAAIAEYDREKEAAASHDGSRPSS